MPKYDVIYVWEEVHSDSIRIKAETAKEAVEKVQEMLDRDDIDLTGSDATWDAIPEKYVSSACCEETDELWER